MDTQQSENKKIVHININGISNKRTELIHYLNEHNPQFMTVNESKIRKQHKIKIPNYHIIRKDRENARCLGGGVAILVREDIKFDQIDTSQFNEDFIAISFISEKRKIALATIYNPPNIEPNIDNFKHILNRFQHSIFMGDYNSEHEYFECIKSNKEGDYLFNVVEELNLLVMNDDSPTFYKNITAPGDILDLAIVSRSMATRVATCEIGLDVGSGTPQGSVLCPLLVLIYVNDLPIDPLDNQVKISQFADNLGMWTFGANNVYVQYRISKTLKDLEAWCAKWRIKLNPKKTQLIIVPS